MKRSKSNLFLSVSKTELGNDKPFVSTPRNRSALFSLDASKNISWSGLSALSENHTHHFVWENYEIQKHITPQNPKGSGFIIFTKMENCSANSPSILRRDPDTGCKLHIALNSEDIQTAFNPILQILLKYQIDHYKVVLESKLEELIAQKQFGKIFTIYTANLSPKKTNELAHEINTTLLALNIKPPKKTAVSCEARQDKEIAGCEFVTLAYPRQNMMQYKIFSNPLQKDTSPSNSVSITKNSLEISVWQRENSSLPTHDAFNEAQDDDLTKEYLQPSN